MQRVAHRVAQTALVVAVIAGCDAAPHATGAPSIQAQATRAATPRPSVTPWPYPSLDLPGPPTPPATFPPDPEHWTAVGLMSHARSLHGASLLPDGRVLVTGGRTLLPLGEYEIDGVSHDSAELFDPATGRWSAAATMHEAREGHLSVALADGRVLIIGGDRDPVGRADTQRVTSGEIYDPATNTWSLVADVPDRQRWVSGTVLGDGRVLLIGWSSRDYPNEQQASLFDPARGTWSSVPGTTRVRGGHHAIALPSGAVLVAGGFDPRAEDLVSLDDAALYDPKTNTWSAAGPMSAAGYDLPMELLPDGRVLALSDPIQAYDPATGAWAIVDGPGSFARSIALADGRILAFPDADGSASAVTLRIYNPASPTWAPSGRFIQVVEMTLTRLLDGRVLSAGGYLGCYHNNPCPGGDIADAWAFDPAGAP